mgnify:FL=1
MGADIKALKTRIKSIDSTLQITSAMGLVASSKLRQATVRMTKANSYASGAEKIIKILSSCEECKNGIYMKKRDGRKCVVVIAGDRGLAGGYNSFVFKKLDAIENADVYPIGRRICDRVSKPFVSSEFFSSAEAYALADELTERYVSGEYSEIDIICTKYVSALKQETYVKTLLPLNCDGEKMQGSAEFEPDAPTVMNSAVNEYLASAIFACVRESFVCELTERRSAMDNADRNARQMLDDLHIQYNRARQGAVTQEITEITAGSGE